PLLCYKLLPKHLSEEEGRVIHFCKRWYQPMLEWSLRHGKKILLGAVAVLILALALIPRLGSEFLPELNEGAIWINMPLPSSVSVSESQAIIGQVRRALRNIPEVRTVISKAGRPEDGTDPKLINMAEFFVDVSPRSGWRGHLTKEQLVAERAHALDALPGIDASFSQPIRDNILESISQID